MITQKCIKLFAQYRVKIHKIDRVKNMSKYEEK